MIPANAIVKIAPAAKPYADELVRQMTVAGIMDSAKRASMFLGQVHVESGGFTTLVESLNYSVTALKTLFGRHRISLSDAKEFGRTQARPANQRALANLLYGGEWGRKNLGNTEPDDGWRFRGRGLKQLTGRGNYRAFAVFMGDSDLLAHPERIADEPAMAAASAVWFWTSHGLNAEADHGTVASVTRIVNGGAMGLAERIRWTETYRGAWVDFSNVESAVHSTERMQ